MSGDEFMLNPDDIFAKICGSYFFSKTDFVKNIGTYQWLNITLRLHFWDSF